MANTMTLPGKVAVVTGAGSGIGRAIALEFARQGAQVFAGDYDPLPDTLESFQHLGVTLLPTDVRRDEQLHELVETAARSQGRIDILVNNAGVTCVGAITEISVEQWDNVMQTNVRAAFVGCRSAIPWMKQQGGSIINISSNAGLLPRSHDPAYSISKASLIALTKSLALCHSMDRIRVNAICPGPVENTRIMNADLDQAADRAALAEKMIQASPLARAAHRMITPEEVAQAAVYLASDATQMVTGTMIAIDGGKSLGVPPSPKISS